MGKFELRILAGSGRSGTTWLLDVLCQANNMTPIFEPLHPAAYDDAKKFSRKYAGAAHEWPQLLKFWQGLAQAEYSKLWSIYRIRPDRLWPTIEAFKSVNGIKRYLAHWLRLRMNRSKYSAVEDLSRVLIKVIRANLMLPFVVNNTQAMVVFVIRHPAAVVESQLRLGQDWNAQRIAEQYCDDERLEQRLGHTWAQLMGCMRSDAELFTLIWCVDNLIAIEDLQNNDGVQFLFYENLAEYDEESWRLLLSQFDLEKMPTQQMLEVPSQQASENLANSKPKSRDADAPLKRLSQQQKDDIQRVLKMFDVSMYDTASIQPRQHTVGVTQPWSGSVHCPGDSQ